MNELAYDISYLLESEADLIQTERPKPRMASTPIKVPKPSGISLAEEALISELTQINGAHEELIQQYLRVTPVQA